MVKKVVLKGIPETLKAWEQVGFSSKPAYEEMLNYLEPYKMKVRLKEIDGELYKYEKALNMIANKLGIHIEKIRQAVKYRWCEYMVHPISAESLKTKEAYDNWTWREWKDEWFPKRLILAKGYMKVDYRTMTSLVTKFITKKGVEVIESWYDPIEKTFSGIELQESKSLLQQFIPFGKDNKVEYGVAAQIITKLYGIGARKTKANNDNLTSILEGMDFIHSPYKSKVIWEVTETAKNKKFMDGYSKDVETISKDGSTKTHKEYLKFFYPAGIDKLERVLTSFNHKITIESIGRLQEAIKTSKTLNNYNIDLESIKKQLEKEMGWDTDSSVDIEEPVQNWGEYIPYDTGLSRIQNSLQDIADCMDLEYTVLTKSIDTWIKERGWLERPQGSLGDGYVVAQTAKEEGYMADEYNSTFGGTQYQIYFTQNGMKFVIDDFTRELTQLAMDKLYEEVECTPLSIRKVYGDRIKELIKENPHTLVSITIITDTSPIPYYGTMQDIPDRLLDKQLENVSVSMTGEVYVVTGKEKK